MLNYKCKGFIKSHKAIDFPEHMNETDYLKLNSREELSKLFDPKNVQFSIEKIASQLNSDEMSVRRFLIRTGLIVPKFKKENSYLNNKNFLMEQLEKMSQKKFMETYGVSVNTLSNALLMHGLAKPKYDIMTNYYYKKFSNKEWFVENLDGVVIRDILKKYDIYSSTLKYFAKKHGFDSDLSRFDLPLILFPRKSHVKIKQAKSKCSKIKQTKIESVGLSKEHQKEELIQTMVKNYEKLLRLSV